MVLTLSEQDEGGLKGLAEQMLNPMKDLHAKPGVVELVCSKHLGLFLTSRPKLLGLHQCH